MASRRGQRNTQITWPAPQGQPACDAPSMQGDSWIGVSPSGGRQRAQPLGLGLGRGMQNSANIFRLKLDPVWIRCCRRLLSQEGLVGPGGGGAHASASILGTSPQGAPAGRPPTPPASSLPPGAEVLT